jgi:hypothetical protein
MEVTAFFGCQALSHASIFLPFGGQGEGESRIGAVRIRKKTFPRDRREASIPMGEVG